MVGALTCGVALQDQPIADTSGAYHDKIGRMLGQLLSKIPNMAIHQTIVLDVVCFPDIHQDFRTVESLPNPRSQQAKNLKFGGSEFDQFVLTKGLKSRGIDENLPHLHSSKLSFLGPGSSQKCSHSSEYDRFTKADTEIVVGSCFKTGEFVKDFHGTAGDDDGQIAEAAKAMAKFAGGPVFEIEASQNKIQGLSAAGSFALLNTLSHETVIPLIGESPHE